MNIAKMANEVFNKGKNVFIVDASVRIPVLNYPHKNDNGKIIYNTQQEHILSELAKSKASITNKFQQNKNAERQSDYIIDVVQISDKFVHISIQAVVNMDENKVKSQTLAQKLNKICDENDWKPFSKVKSHFFTQILKNDVTEEQILARIEHQMTELDIEQCDYVVSIQDKVTMQTKTIKVNGEDFEDPSPRNEVQPQKILKVTIFYIS